MFVQTSTVPIAELQQISLMAFLNDRQLRHLQKSTRIIHIEEEERLFYQGQAADKFFFVRSGQIKQFRVSIDGNGRVIDIIQPGSFIAESLILHEKPFYPFSADAIVNTQLLAFNFGTFIEILEDSRETCFKLMSSMGANIHQYLEQVDYLTLQNASFRLVNYLLKQVPGNHQEEAPYTIYLAAPKSVIASWLSIKPETLSRQLGALKAQNLIKVCGKTITINDISQLRQMVA